METENACLRSTTNVAVIDVPVILIETVIQVSRVCFAGVLQASVEDGTVFPKLS